MAIRMRTAATLLAGALLAAALPTVPAKADRVSDAVADFRAGQADEAAQVLEPLARTGHPDAQFWLGTMYYQGRGKPRLYGAALAWYRRAAEQGNADAQNNLGLMYRNGEGVEASRLLAYAWFTLAAGHGNSVARANLDALADGMTPAQILQGQQLAEEQMHRIDTARRRPAPARAPVSAAAAATALPPVPALNEVRVVQIGLFRNADGVRRIRDRLKGERLERSRLALRDEEVVIRGERYRRLRVGPFARAEDARVWAQRLDRLLGVDSAVIPVPAGR
ncbi:SPOR domain-containing protein [Azospirillum sp. B2RO_4]|uniref:SPOR domain-containing protein n=1 Tax=Azospirillum sp. B2RO_4 TaxID=3027796 RepID=UPI003DA9B1B8